MVALWTDFYPAAEGAEGTLSIVPPAPMLVARSNSSMTLQPRRWFAAPIPLKRKHRPGDHNRPVPPPQAPTVAYLRLFGKAAGAGTDVTLNNLDLTGTGVPVEYDAATGCTKPITVKG